MRVCASVCEWVSGAVREGGRERERVAALTAGVFLYKWLYQHWCGIKEGKRRTKLSCWREREGGEGERRQLARGVHPLAAVLHPF